MNLLAHFDAKRLRIRVNSITDKMGQKYISNINNV